MNFFFFPHLSRFLSQFYSIEFDFQNEKITSSCIRNLNIDPTNYDSEIICSWKGFHNSPAADRRACQRLKLNQEKKDDTIHLPNKSLEISHLKGVK